MRSTDHLAGKTRTRSRAALLLPILPLAVLAFGAAGSRSALPQSDAQTAPLPSDYRQWQVVSVAHEAGDLNDIRVILANPIALAAFRSGKRPFPDGSMIARLAWTLVPSDRNNAIFGREQSFVAGAPTNVQIEVKNARMFAGTGGWGYAQFRNGRPDPKAQPSTTCFACHNKLPAADDRIFTAYAD
jgi:hypothetical protein